MPTFLVGLYFGNRTWDEIHPWCLSAGVWAGLIFVFAFYFGYLSPADEPMSMNAGIMGTLLQIVVFVGCEGMLRLYKKFAAASPQTESPEEAVQKEAVPETEDAAPEEAAPEESAIVETDKKDDSVKTVFSDHRPEWDHPKIGRFGEAPLTPSLLNKMMAGVSEPFKEPWYALLLFLSVSIITPLVAEGQPLMDENREFVSPPPIIRGLPWWFFKQILLCIIPYLFILTTVKNLPNEYPFDEMKVDEEGMDPDILEMTIPEMNRRTSYDTRNESIRRRRSTLREKMEEMGYHMKDPDEEEAPPPRRLSAFLLEEQAKLVSL